MSHTHRRALASLIVAATVAVGPVTAAFAQSDASDATPITSSDVKAQHKAASKARRAHKNAELKKLEKNGYNPATNDPKYPDKLQNAEKKADGQ